MTYKNWMGYAAIIIFIIGFAAGFLTNYHSNTCYYNKASLFVTSDEPRLLYDLEDGYVFENQVVSDEVSYLFTVGKLIKIRYDDEKPPIIMKIECQNPIFVRLEI